MPARSATSATVNGRSAAATALSTDSALRRLLTADRAEPSASESGPASISGLAISTVRIVDKLAVFWSDYPHSVKPTLRPPCVPAVHENIDRQIGWPHRPCAGVHSASRARTTGELSVAAHHAGRGLRTGRRRRRDRAPGRTGAEQKARPAGGR